MYPIYLYLYIVILLNSQDLSENHSCERVSR